MNILIRAAKIIHPGSGLNGQKKNILIKNGYIEEITDAEPKSASVIEGKDLHVSIGWFDFNSFVGDPGLEHKEDIETLAKAAAAGGYTELLSLPNTKPVVQSKDVLSYIQSKSAQTILTIHPIAAVTLQTKGEELTEMIDLFSAGAIAFSDGDHPIWHSDILLKALQYTQKFNGLIIQRPEDRLLSAHGQMNEGRTSTFSGLKGIPSLAEDVMVLRDLRILEYTGGKIHFSLLSTPTAIALVKEAKKKGFNVTCDIPAYLLALDDSVMDSFDTFLKVNPPIRAKKEQEFFRKAVREGIVDIVASAHRPHESECKNLEFDLAEFGMESLETTFSLVNEAMNGNVESIIERIALTPRKIVGLEIPKIEVGAKANLTVFDPAIEWEVKEKDIKSKSKNNPFIGKTLKGRALAVFNNKKFSTNQ